MQTRLMSLSFDSRVRQSGLDTRRRRVDSVDLLSRRESRALPRRPLYVERVVLAKSYVVHWLPDGRAFRP